MQQTDTPRQFNPLELDRTINAQGAYAFWYMARFLSSHSVAIPAERPKKFARPCGIKQVLAFT